MRSAIQQRLRSDGVYDEITARVRSSLLHLLLNNDNATEPEFKKKHTLQDIAWQSLVYHFLRKKNFVHSLSVFSAECGLENGNDIQLSLEDSIKALGLGHIWEEHTKLDTEGIEDILNTVTQLFASGNFNCSPATREVQSISVSAQTEIIAESYCGENKENDKLLEQRLELDLRQEMNEKLRVSAKKQALNASRRCEEKYKDEIASLKQQIDRERAKSKQIENDWEEKFLSVELLMEKKQKRLILERDAFESDVMMLKDQKSMQTRELANKQDELEEQKHRLRSEINEILREREEIRATEIMCASLQSEKESMLDEIKLLRNQLASLHKTKDMVHQSSAQIKAEQVKLSQEHRVLERRNAQLECQVQLLEETNRKISLQLERAKSETTSLRSLLRQSQCALESISFRDKESLATDFSWRAIMASRSSKSSHRNSCMPLPSTPAPRPNTTTSLKQASRIDRTYCFSDVSDSTPLIFKLSESNMELNKLSDTDSGKKLQSIEQQHRSGNDPPVFSPKDPQSVRSVMADDSHQHVDNTCASSHENTVLNTVPSKNSMSRIEVGALIHQKEDDTSTISEITSRQDLVRNETPSSKTEILIIRSDCIACSPQDHLSESGQTGTHENQIVQSNLNVDDQKDAHKSNTGISTDSAVSPTDTTLYSESFYSNVDALQTISKEENGSNANIPEGPITSNVQINDNRTHSHEIDNGVISRHELESTDSPQSVYSNTSFSGYTTSFCTEDEPAL